MKAASIAAVTRPSSPLGMILARYSGMAERVESCFESIDCWNSLPRSVCRAKKAKAPMPHNAGSVRRARNGIVLKRYRRRATVGVLTASVLETVAGQSITAIDSVSH